MDGAWVCEAGVAPLSSGKEKMKKKEAPHEATKAEDKHVYAPTLNESHIGVTEDRDDSEL